MKTAFEYFLPLGLVCLIVSPLSGCKDDECKGRPAEAQIDVSLQGIDSGKVKTTEVKIIVNNTNTVTRRFNIPTPSFVFEFKTWDQTPRKVTVRATSYDASSKALGTGQITTTFEGNGCNHFTVAVKAGGAPVDAGIDGFVPDALRPDVQVKDTGMPDVVKDTAIPDIGGKDAPKPIDQKTPDTKSSPDTKVTPDTLPPPDSKMPDVQILPDQSSVMDVSLPPDLLKPDAPKPKPDSAPPKPDMLKSDVAPKPDTCALNACGGCTPLIKQPGTPCGTCGSYSCVGKNSVTCTEAPEMIALAKFCVDPYEASAWSASSCTGTQYGTAGDDYPSGFPNNVASKGVAGANQTVAVYACSVANVLPARFVTWSQAKRACENVNKRLCTETEWATMCAGPSSFSYPYGNSYQPSWCNTADAGYSTVAKTGQFTKCTGGYTGIHDVGGNVAEMLTDVTGAGCVSPRGGTYLNGLEAVKCTAALWTCPGMGTGANTGFRCCRTRP